MPDEQQQPSAGVARRDRVGEPDVPAVHPPEVSEDEERLRDAARRRVSATSRRQLGDGEDEDEIEEQLDRRDPYVVHGRAARVAVAPSPFEGGPGGPAEGATLVAMSPAEPSPTTARLRREPPRFRLVAVRRVERLGPRMVRVTVAGPELEGLIVEQPAASVRLLLPSPGRPSW